ncbi:MAG: NUDIX hydrolase [Deltaproteobacteria bacterium]|nr:NUDIX hydrolase [Deltaproteobacteria bacterium]
MRSFFYLCIYVIFNDMKHPSHIVAVGTLVENKRGQFLLVKTEWRGWEMPGGQVEEGEDIISALKREVMEESSIDIEIKRLAAVYSSVSEPSKVILDFLSEYNGGDIQKATSEILDAKWFSKKEILPVIQTDPMKYRIQWLLENQNKIRHVSYTKNPFKVQSEVLL